MVSTRSQTDVNPIVSVIIPAHNYARYLVEAIDSVREQSLEDWECIVVDDGSTDVTPDVLARVTTGDPRIRMYRQERAGPSAARNLGLRHARGRYIQFLDADDRLHPQKLANHVAALDEDPSFDIVYGPTQYVTEGTPGSVRPMHDPAISPLHRLTGAPDKDLLLLLAANRLAIEAPLVPASLIAAVGSFDPRLSRMEDWELWLRCALAGVRFRYAPSLEPMATVRVHAASTSQREGPMIWAEIEIRRRLRMLLGQRRAAQALNSSRLHERCVELAIKLVLRGSPREGLRAMRLLTEDSRMPRWARVVAIPALALGPGRRLFVGTVARRLRRRMGPGRC